MAGHRPVPGVPPGRGGGPRTESDADEAGTHPLSGSTCGADVSSGAGGTQPAAAALRCGMLALVARDPAAAIAAIAIGHAVWAVVGWAVGGVAAFVVAATKTRRGR